MDGGFENVPDGQRQSKILSSSGQTAMRPIGNGFHVYKRVSSEPCIMPNVPAKTVSNHPPHSVHIK